jgi:hypothetical protein
MDYRFSGHETFPCRYAWLPKAFRTIRKNPTAFSKDDVAMVDLGVGKNMARAIRFWVHAMGIAEPRTEGGYQVTAFGESLLDEKKGWDPYLEDRSTLWLLHWKLATHVNEPLFAWDYLLNRWPHPEMTRTEVVREFEAQASRLGRKLSPVTLEQHFDVFLHSYVPTRSTKGEILEDNLDCPLVELELIRSVGERAPAGKGRREVIYAFRRQPKPDISPALFAYCLEDFWRKRRDGELTLSFREISVGEASPGQIFKLPDTDVRQRLESISLNDDTFIYQESAAVQRVTHKQKHPPELDQLLASVYSSEVVHA